MATDKVVHRHNLVLWHLEAHNPLVATRYACLDLLLRERERCGQLLAYLVVVGKGLACLLGLLAQSVKLLRGVEGVVCPAGINQLSSILQIYLTTLALAIGGVRATNANTLVNLNATPLERLDDVVLGTGYKAL